MSKDKYGVHIAHCCYIHGCKYGDEDCPVASGEVAQKYICYDCTEEYEPYTLEEIELLRKTKSYRPTHKQLKDKVANLEAKLAESENQIDKLQTFNKSLNSINENLRKRLDNIRTNSKKDYIRNMEQQLAEKDKTIEILRIDLKDYQDLEEKISTKYDKVVEKLAQADQDKISFAVEQLDKVKSFCISAEDNGWCVTHKDWLDIVEFIDNQIKQLKDGK